MSDFYCPMCDRMIDRRVAEQHLQSDAERNDDSVSPLELVFRLINRAKGGGNVRK